MEKSDYGNFYLKNFVGSYFEGSFQKMVSFFARKNDINSRELEEMMKYVEKDIQKPKSDD